MKIYFIITNKGRSFVALALFLCYTSPSSSSLSASFVVLSPPSSSIPGWVRLGSVATKFVIKSAGASPVPPPSAALAPSASVRPHHQAAAPRPNPISPSFPPLSSSSSSSSCSASATTTTKQPFRARGLPRAGPGAAAAAWHGARRPGGCTRRRPSRRVSLPSCLFFPYFSFFFLFSVFFFLSAGVTSFRSYFSCW